MDYERSSSSGADDLPPSQRGRAAREGQFSGNARAGYSSGHYERLPASDQYLRKLERDAYVAILRAFTAQSGAMTWHKERLMVTLRQELRISDDLHLEILEEMTFNSAPRERDEEVAPMYVPDVEPRRGATQPGSRKKPKSTHVSQASLAHPMLKSGLPPPTFSPTSTGKQAQIVGESKSKKSRGGRQKQTGWTVESRMPSLVGLSAGEGLAPGFSPWVGKRVKLRWPEDNTFYEAVITKYKPDKDLHAFVYDIGTKNETREWVDLKKLAPTDLQIVDETNEGPPPPTATANLTLGKRRMAGRGTRRGRGRIGPLSPVGRGRSASKGPANASKGSALGFPSRNRKASMPEDGLDMKGIKHIQLKPLDDLVKQVDKIDQEDDLAKVQSVIRTAKEHEEMLRKALAEVGESSEEGGTAGEEETPPLSPIREGEKFNRQNSRDQHGDDGEDVAAADREGSDGDPLAGNVAASDADDDRHDCGDGDDR
eukprot:c16613_g1_i1 orf=446-1897(-)